MVNGTQVGPTPSLSTGESYVFPYDPVSFENTATVNLYEDDSWPNGDDYIATVSFSADPANEVLKYMDGDGGLYNVYFNIA